MLTLTAMIAIGLLTGMVTGLTGASGVAIVVPLVNLLLHFPVHEAIGTSLMVDVIASVSVAWTYYRAGNINLKAGLWVALGSIAGAQFGAAFAGDTSPEGLRFGFGLVSIVMGIMMFRKGLNAASQRAAPPADSRRRVLLALVLGFGVGIMTGFFGAGGGIMIFMVLLFVLRLPLHQAIGTSTLMMTVTALSGAVGYGLNGNIVPAAGLLIGLSAVAGGLGSASLANRIDAAVLGRIVGALFVVLGLTMSILGLRA